MLKKNFLTKYIMIILSYNHFYQFAIPCFVFDYLYYGGE